MAEPHSQNHHLHPPPDEQQHSTLKMTEDDHNREIKKHNLHPSSKVEGSRYGYGYGYGYGGARGRRGLSMFLVILLVLAGITALTVWLVYRPQNPKFRVVNAAVYQLNTTGTSTTTGNLLISTTMQFTLITRNPNRRVSFQYDQLTAFVTYRDRAITQPAILPPLFHNTKSTVALSPVLGGSGVPVAQEVVNGLEMDQAAYGVVGLRLVLTGKLKYKSRVVFRSGRYGIYVRCDLFVGLRRGFVGQLPLLGSPRPCTVDV